MRCALGFVEAMDSASYPGVPAVYDAWHEVDS